MQVQEINRSFKKNVCGKLDKQQDSFSPNTDNLSVFFIAFADPNWKLSSNYELQIWINVTETFTEKFKSNKKRSKLFPKIVAKIVSHLTIFESFFHAWKCLFRSLRFMKTKRQRMYFFFRQLFKVCVHAINIRWIFSSFLFNIFVS